MRHIVLFVVIGILCALPTQVFAQYPGVCNQVCSQPPRSDCGSVVGPGSFPVCNHSLPCPPKWSCTQATGCTDSSAWSPWSGCVGGATGETRYCVKYSCCQNSAEARLCGSSGGPGGPGGPTATPGCSNPSCSGGVTPTIVPTPTPIPIGTIKARAVQVDPSDTSCTAIRAVPTTAGQITGTSIGFTASSADQPTPQTQSGANYVTFANEPGGIYTVDPQVPSGNWVLAGYCWSNTNGTPPSTGASSTLGDAETLTWDVGYTLGTGWVQTEGGDVYASGTIKSYIPVVAPRVFSEAGDGGYPGVVTYGTTYDFDGTSISQGGKDDATTPSPLR